MKSTTLDRDMRRRASLHARRQQSDIEFARRLALLAQGMFKTNTRTGPGKRSCVVEMRRLAEKRDANIARYHAGRYDW